MWRSSISLRRRGNTQERSRRGNPVRSGFGFTATSRYLECGGKRRPSPGSNPRLPVFGRLAPRQAQARNLKKPRPTPEGSSGGFACGSGAVVRARQAYPQVAAEAGWGSSQQYPLAHPGASGVSTHPADRYGSSCPGGGLKRWASRFIPPTVRRCWSWPGWT